MMYQPKQDIYSILKTLNYYVGQQQPEEFTELPAIIYKVSNNAIDILDLDNNILVQDIVVTIDIWAKSSTGCSNVFIEVEEVMRANDYIVDWSSDIPNPFNIYHWQARFKQKYV